MSAQPSELSARLIDIFGNPATADPTKMYGNLTLNPNGTVSVGSGLVLPDGYTTYVTPMGRNRIINGDIRVAQRSSVTFASGNAGYAGPDRFFTSNGTGGGSFTQSVGTITYNGVARNAAVLTVNTANTSLTGGNFWQGFQQRIEGTNCYDMIGQSIAVSFIFNTNVTGTYCFTLIDGAVAQSYMNTFTATANTPQKVTFIIPAPTTPLSIPNTNGIGLYVNIGFLNTGTYQTTAPNVGTWQSTIYYTAPSATNWGATPGNFIAITELQVEPGPYATPFERVNIAEQLLRCQRYYEQISTAYYGAGGCNGATTAYVVIPWTVSKRAAPSCTASAASTFYIWSGGTANQVIAGITVTGAGLTTALATLTISGATAGQACILGQQTAGSYIALNSEL